MCPDGGNDPAGKTVDVIDRSAVPNLKAEILSEMHTIRDRGSIPLNPHVAETDIYSA